MTKVENQAMIGQCQDMLHEAIGLLLECDVIPEAITSLAADILQAEQEQL
jgi:hypothetical protein